VHISPSHTLQATKKAMAANVPFGGSQPSWLQLSILGFFPGAGASYPEWLFIHKIFDKFKEIYSGGYP
jgi:hypothetical protein